MAAPTRSLLLAIGVLWAACALGAVPVEESVGQRTDGAGASQTQAGESRRLAELFYQLQVLEQEVQELRGLVEEQGHQLKRMARDQQERYIDLDRRVSGLRAGPATPGSASGPSPAGAPRPAAAPGSASASERDAYTRAFNLMKEQQFDASARAFSALIADYPNGEFTPNAFYWLGELHLAKAEFEQARQWFAQVTNLYPGHQKVPDALYKLGVVYHRLGDNPRALEYLNRVRRDHPQSSAAGLAQTYAAELQ